MRRVDLKIGFICNNNCKFCVQAHKKEFGKRSIRQLKQHLEYEAANYKEVVFTGGEPTINDDIISLIEHSKRLGYSLIQVQSNGRMFAYKDFCLKIVEAGANEFAIAIHGHIAKLHDYLTSSEGGFKQTIKGIENILSMGQRVITNTVITKSNYRHLGDIARLLVHIGIKQFQFAFIHILGNSAKYIDAMVPRKTLVESYVKKALDIGILAKAIVMTEAIPYCFMRGYEKYIAEENIPKTKIYDLDYIIDDFTEIRQKEGKTKDKQCKYCYYYNICEGPWREYPEKFGWGEFKPIKLD